MSLGACRGLSESHTSHFIADRFKFSKVHAEQTQERDAFGGAAAAAAAAADAAAADAAAADAAAAAAALGAGGAALKENAAGVGFAAGEGVNVAAAAAFDELNAKEGLGAGTGAGFTPKTNPPAGATGEAGKGFFALLGSGGAPAGGAPKLKPAALNPPAGCAYVLNGAAAGDACI